MQVNVSVVVDCLSITSIKDVQLLLEFLFTMFFLEKELLNFPLLYQWLQLQHPLR